MSSRVAEIVDRQRDSRRADIPCTNMAQLADAAHSGAPPRLDFTVLAVPEHTLFLSDERDDQPSLEPSSRVASVLELTPGMHLRHHPHIRALRLEKPKIEAPRGRVVRYYALERDIID